uniref:TLDc domain-containing protein n=1 Tax=Ditylum brightwellii TaxID=49249 RepID=A0A7S2EA53_9STRA
MKILYRASHDGWQASNFHAKCDNQGPTLTVIRTTEDYIFGGFCDTPWSSDGGYKSASKTFLFSLHCFSGLSPTKMRLKDGHASTAVCHNGFYGPTFGRGFDLYVGNEASTTSVSYTKVGGTYQYPAGLTNTTFLTGGRHFQASEVEVFSVRGTS